MSAEHIKELALIEAECFSVPWSEDALRAEITKDNSRFFVAITKNSDNFILSSIRTASIHYIIDGEYVQFL